MIPAVEAHELTNRSAIELAAGIREGAWSAAEVTQAHIARIEQVNPALNAVVVKLYDDARRTATAIDDARRRGEPLGPLAGVPVTIKECFDIAGTPTTIGLPHRAKSLANGDAVLVARLRAAGAVILGKTNVPQLMIMHESDNPLYGRTLHPSSEYRSPGGSSGGEAAIIAAHGSPLGLASDLGGSIRQPAHSCGICGFKPTAGRLTNRGSTNIFSGLEVLGGQPGPMTRTAADLAVAMQVFTGDIAAPVDCVTPPMPWNNERAASAEPLRVGYWIEDGMQRPSPAIRRAVESAAAALRGAGVHVEQFEPPAVSELMQLYFRLISANGGGTLGAVLGGDAPQPAIRRLLRLATIPRWTRPGLGGALRKFGQSGAAWLLENTGGVSAAEFWKLVAEARRFQRLYVDQIVERKLTTLLCPPHNLVALTHGSSEYLPLAASPCMMMNLLGLPAGVIPWTTVARGEESDRAASNDRVERAALAIEADSAGLPVGVQIVGRPWDDEGTIAAMQQLERLRKTAR